jgi:3-oxoacyl-[acyl-carrier protein] reductase
MTRDINDRLDLTGKVIVVTGAGNGGIGTGVCRLLAEAGASIMGLDVREEAFVAFEQAVAGTNGPHATRVVDARDPEQMTAAVTAAVDELGPLWGLVHVVGGQTRDQWKTVADADYASWDAIMELNLRTALISITAAAGQLLRQGTGGSIVSIASVAGLTAMPFGAGYAAAKAAVVSLVRTAALELGPAQIRVNAVAPGTVRTTKTGGNTVDSPAEQAAVPLGRRGNPDDIAGGVLYLMSGLSSWVTGQVLAVDGGSSARPSFLGEDNLPVFIQDPAFRANILAGRQE